MASCADSAANDRCLHPFLGNICRSDGGENPLYLFGFLGWVYRIFSGTGICSARSNVAKHEKPKPWKNVVGDCVWRTDEDRLNNRVVFGGSTCYSQPAVVTVAGHIRAYANELLVGVGVAVSSFNWRREGII